MKFLVRLPFLMDLQVRLTFGQMDPLLGEALGEVDILSYLQVRLTFGQMDPPVATSCSQVCSYFSQVDLWSDVPPC